MIVVSIIKQREKFVATVNHSEYKDALLNTKFLRYLMNRIKSKPHKIETFEINIIFLSCFDEKIYILNKGYDELVLGY